MKLSKQGILDKLGINFLNSSGNKELLASNATITSISARELPSLEVEDVLIKNDKVLNQLDPSTINEAPLIHKGNLSDERPVRVEQEVSTDAPLVSGPSNNVFIKAGSVINGFDVTGPTPKVEPIIPTQVVPQVISEVQTNEPIISTSEIPQINTPYDKEIENVINSEVYEAPKREVMYSEPVLETPEEFNKSLEVSPTTEINKPVISPYIPQETPENKNAGFTDSYIDSIAKIEKLRSELNQTLEELKVSINSQLDEVSRNIEKTRQIANNDKKIISESLESGINSLAGGYSVPEQSISR